MELLITREAVEDQVSEQMIDRFLERTGVLNVRGGKVIEKPFSDWDVARLQVVFDSSTWTGRPA